MQNCPKWAVGQSLEQARHLTYLEIFRQCLSRLLSSLIWEKKQKVFSVWKMWQRPPPVHHGSNEERLGLFQEWTVVAAKTTTPVKELLASQRPIMRTALALPVVKAGYHVCALRVMWRTDIDSHWPRLLEYRAAVDQLLCSKAGASLIVSCLTCLYTHPNPRTKTDKSEDVYPGLAYWIACKNKDYGAAVSQIIMYQCPEATIRFVRVPNVTQPQDVASRSLCAVVKDHESSWLKKQLQEAGVDVSNHAFAKLFIFDPALKQLSHTAMDSMARNRIHMTVTDLC